MSDSVIWTWIPTALLFPTAVRPWFSSFSSSDAMALPSATLCKIKTAENDWKQSPQIRDHSGVPRDYLVIDYRSHTWNVTLIKTQAWSKPRPNWKPISAAIMTAAFRIADSTRMFATCRYGAMGASGPNCATTVRRCNVKRMEMKRDPYTLSRTFDARAIVRGTATRRLLSLGYIPSAT